MTKTGVDGSGLPMLAIPLLLLGGMRVVESSALPLAPSPGMNAQRIVRHGMADVVRWLGEEVGPKPGEETHSFLSADGRTLIVSPSAHSDLCQQAEAFRSINWF